VSFFFDNMPDGARPPDTTRPRATAGGLAEEAAPFDHASRSGLSDDDAFQRRETLELVRAYYRIDDPVLRKRLFELAKALADYCEETARPAASTTPEDASAEPCP
jgi:hypothetical protein